MSRARKRGLDMSSKKCTLTGLGKDDGIDMTVILHKTKRHVHQLAIEAIYDMLSARCTDGGVKLHNETILIKCGAPLGAKQICNCWIGLANIKLAVRGHKDIDNLLQKLWFRAKEKAGKVAYCPITTCIGGKGFVLDDSSIKTVICPVCSEHWCNKCKEDHVGECNATGDAMKDVQRCPDCSTAWFKDIGCDHMQCSCGCYFCYCCGAKITGKYNFHVRYSPDHGTYICPQRHNNKDFPPIIVQSPEEIATGYADYAEDGEILIPEFTDPMEIVGREIMRNIMTNNK